MDVACSTGRHLLAERKIDGAMIGAAGGTLDLSFGAERDMDTLEVRLFSEDGFQAVIAGVEILVQ